ncbi:MAG TPA: hypothetical protein VFF32_05810 [Dermatophilaceae bacterium]|nr:hypothetical protein [Dermatophilaceae bacterium]
MGAGVVGLGVIGAGVVVRVVGLGVVGFGVLGWPVRAGELVVGAGVEVVELAVDDEVVPVVKPGLGFSGEEAQAEASNSSPTANVVTPAPRRNIGIIVDLHRHIHCRAMDPGVGEDEGPTSV